MCGVHTALVEGQVHSLHLVDLHLPWGQQLLHPAQHLAQEPFCLPQDLGTKKKKKKGDQKGWQLRELAGVRAYDGHSPLEVPGSAAAAAARS